MNKKRIAVLLLLLMLLQGCAAVPVWEQLPKVELAPTPAPPMPAPTPAFSMMEYVDAMFGGGHSIEDNTLRLERDVVIGAPIYLADCDGLTIDFNGYALRYETYTSEASENGKTWMLVIDSGRVNLTSGKSGARICCGMPGRSIGVMVMGHAALFLDNIGFEIFSGASETQSGEAGGCCLYITDGAYAEIHNGTFSGDCGIFVEDPKQEGTTVVINGGVFGCEDASFGACFKDTATVILNDGVFCGSLYDIYVQDNPVATVDKAAFDTVGDTAGSGWQPELAGEAARMAAQEEAETA